MEFLFDTANIADIKKYGEIFPCTGITSNPSIIKAEGKIDFFPHFRKIRQLIGKERTLHIQILAEDCDSILKEADLVFEHVDPEVYIKIPTTEEGLKAMRALKKRDANVTATAIYSKIQGFMAIACGVDFIAPYCNRMENHNINPSEVIAAFAKMIDRQGSQTKIVAASFKNISQVNEAFMAGAQTVTLVPSLLHEVFSMAAIQKSVNDFRADWEKSQGASFAALAEADSLINA
jgi:Transaldolase